MNTVTKTSLCGQWLLLACVPAIAWGQQFAAERPEKPAPVVDADAATHPNDVLRFSTRFLQPVLGQFAKQIDKTSPTRDWVLEALSVGRARTKARTWIDVVPNADQAMFRFQLSGRIYGRATSYRDPVRISSRTTSQINVTKWIRLGPNGAEPYAADARCRTGIQYLGCTADVKGLLKKSLIEKIGMKKAEKKRGAAQAVVARKFERRFEAEVDNEIDGQLAELSSYYIDYHTQPLGAFGVYPEITSATTEHGVELRFRNMWRQIKGAEGPPPAVKPHDFCGLVHQSAINVLGGAYISNEVWQDSDFESMLKEMTGLVPREVRAGSHTVRWSVRFADKQPLECRFLDDNIVELTNRISEYTVAGQTTQDPFLVRVRYQLKQTVWGPEFNRMGKVYYSFAGDTPEPPNDDAAYVKSKIDALWRDQIYLDGIVPPAGGSWDQFRRLDVAELWIKGGWFVFGFDLRDAK